MIHKTPNETTPNLYESDDGLVSVRILDNPHRNPPSSCTVVVFRFTPKAHTRIRDLGNGLFEYLPSNDELGAFLGAFDRANGKFPLSTGSQLKNKPPERKRYYDQQNARRFALNSHRN